MCGICGIANANGERVDREVLARMNERLAHRGPDESGEWISNPVGLAMRRLAIIDLSSGHQPMFNKGRTVALVFNGEIYNYLELRALLSKAGRSFVTQSDTEAILHLYEEYGPSGLSRLNGMFAIAIWDAARQQLLLARDRAGKKPLYYSQLGHRLVFSSELTSLLEYPSVSREIDATALDNYFALGYCPAPLTIFKSVRQLEPGYFLIWKRGNSEAKRYWRLQSQRCAARSEHEAAEQLLELLNDAVRIRLHSDVPFGALLSGGVDSGLVVGLMSQLMTTPVHTFTVGFSEKSFDESQYAADIARHFGAQHHHMIAQPHSIPELLRNVIVHCGEPFADSSAIPTFLVCEMARKHVTMALSGDGGDEVFGGYDSYRYHAIASTYRKCPRPLRGILRHAINKLNGNLGALGRRIQRFVSEAELPVNEAWRHSRSIFTDQELARLYADEFNEMIALDRRGFQIEESFEYFRDGGTDAELLNYVDYESYLPGDILVKIDRMSMANSLELRSPLLDYRMAEFAAGLRAEWKWNAYGGKRILKKVAKSVLPDWVLNRRKHGFVAPLGAWFRGDLKQFVNEVICSSSAKQVVRLDYCQELLERVTRREPGGLERKLWSVLCYLLWFEEFAN
jgi:asparagine synthase (glutamine-hydrolysing)